jgi:hypothetical protein
MQVTSLPFGPVAYLTTLSSCIASENNVEQVAEFKLAGEIEVLGKKSFLSVTNRT